MPTQTITFPFTINQEVQVKNTKAVVVVGGMCVDALGGIRIRRADMGEALWYSPNDFEDIPRAPLVILEEMQKRVDAAGRDRGDLSTGFFNRTLAELKESLKETPAAPE